MVADRYRVERLLGQGGMGAVYVAVDTAADTGTQASSERIALKRLSAAGRATVAALFEREYQTLSGLRHPGIVSVYDYGTDAEGAFYTMELVEGEDLGKQAPMPWREACACLRDAASILGVLHARRLLHRDLSPRNLLRTASGRLKLIDFGALASFGPNPDLVGTPPFVPPEALRGEPLDQRSDLFALGALGYWLITGIHAFPARHLSDLERLHQSTPALPSGLLSLLTKPGDEPVPAELDALLLALLRTDLTARPNSTAELIDRLNAIAELEHEVAAQSVQGYLESKVFVGRERERE
ncbi:MAG: serine/threonine-protein kinase PksC, partial [Myxococcaceae bacterium]|nr:serine/threonine-protein kinase PksC [Myxococcaceae bacterium]